MRPVRVLLVEDDEDLREILVLLFEDDEAFSVSAAIDGVDALVQLSFGPAPDVIVLNLQMPVVGGAEVLEYLRLESDTPAVPVVVATGAAVPEDVVRRASCVLEKPFGHDELLDAIRRVLPGGQPPSPTPPPAVV